MSYGEKPWITIESGGKRSDVPTTIWWAAREAIQSELRIPSRAFQADSLFTHYDREQLLFEVLDELDEVRAAPDISASNFGNGDIVNRIVFVGVSALGLACALPKHDRDACIQDVLLGDQHCSFFCPF